MTTMTMEKSFFIGRAHELLGEIPEDDGGEVGGTLRPALI